MEVKKSALAQPPSVSLRRVRVLRVAVPAIAGVIEVTSVEDYKGRGWDEPVARVEGPHDGWRVAEHEMATLSQALTEAFEMFRKEFGREPRT